MYVTKSKCRPEAPLNADSLTEWRTYLLGVIIRPVRTNIHDRCYLPSVAILTLTILTQNLILTVLTWPYIEDRKYSGANPTISPWGRKISSTTLHRYLAITQDMKTTFSSHDQRDQSVWSMKICYSQSLTHMNNNMCDFMIKECLILRLEITWVCNDDNRTLV